MAPTALTKTTAPGSFAAAGVAVTLAAADVGNGNKFVATGNDLVVVQNTDAVNPYTYTITSVADPYGRTKDITTESIAPSAIRIFGPMKQTGWMQTDGTILILASNAAVKIGVISLP